jgi:hypothetical protein
MKLLYVSIGYAVGIGLLIITDTINKINPYDVGVVVSLPLGLISGYALGSINWKELMK